MAILIILCPDRTTCSNQSPKERQGAMQCALVEMLEVGAVDFAVAGNDVGALAAAFFVDAVAGFDVLGESLLAEFLFVLGPFAHG